MTSILAAYTRALHKYPTIVQSLQAGTTMFMGDVLAQLVVENKPVKDYELIRSARFFALGTCFVGPVLKNWYGVLEKFIGSGTKKQGFKKVLTDQGCFVPIFGACFLSINAAMAGKNTAQIKNEVSSLYKEVLIANYMVWPWVQLVNFTFVPLHHQVLVVQVFALFWNTYLAYTTNKNNSKGEQN